MEIIATGIGMFLYLAGAVLIFRSVYKHPESSLPGGFICNAVIGAAVATYIMEYAGIYNGDSLILPLLVLTELTIGTIYRKQIRRASLMLLYFLLLVVGAGITAMSVGMDNILFSIVIAASCYPLIIAATVLSIFKVCGVNPDRRIIKEEAAANV